MLTNKSSEFFGNKPKTEAIDIDSYLKRIRAQKEKPSISYLKKLHRAHLINVPFENLDIHYKNKIILDYRKIYKKIVSRRRGGFCYELNGLFYHLLYHLGFNSYLISARVKQEEGFSKDYDHMAVLVLLENERWLVDVGFGDSFIYPKKIEINKVQMDYVDYWRVVADPDENLILQQSDDYSSFRSKYFFTLEKKQPIQFMDRCEFHQTSIESHFTKQKLITRLTAKGRIMLTERKLKISELGNTTEQEITNEDEFLSKLRQHFGIGFRQLMRNP
ncbi:MAG: arylamine N-acetyltransferase [Ekhidna sp.]|nr:arylamine N-acetyltransferase [Ekhidna sp.]MBC6409214.1 arylamine N-acetyltransferase [Ekhidna sp.]